MKATTLYDRLIARTDTLQAELKHEARNQALRAGQLQETQAQMKEVMNLIIQEGDRELTGEEITKFGADA